MSDTSARRPTGAVVVLGALSVLVVLVLLAGLPPAATLPAVGVLVAVLGVVGYVLAARARSSGRHRVAASAPRLGTVATVLWFWGVVTGLSHLLRSVFGEPSGAESVLTGAATTAVWVALTWFLRRVAVR